ncbi:MAG: hypothetical protein MJZ54_02935 [Bacteroidaceae bacterium]|nr:hypothetical protein [Bacteroidaceae bacterium]
MNNTPLSSAPDTLDEMRQQLSLLQHRLDHQVEISDRQMRKAVTSRVASLRSFHNMGIVFSIVCAFIVTFGVYEQGVRLPFLVATIVFFTLNTVSGFFLQARKQDCRTAGDMIAAARSMQRYKKLNNRYLSCGIPVVIMWAIWYVYEICLVAGYTTTKAFLGLLLCCTVGGVIGGLIGYYTFHRPAMRRADKIIEQVEEYTAAEGLEKEA